MSYIGLNIRIQEVLQMPAFPGPGKGEKPVPHCPYHDRSLATCPCPYAQDWRYAKDPALYNFEIIEDPPCSCTDREDLVQIILKLIDLLNR